MGEGTGYLAVSVPYFKKKIMNDVFEQIEQQIEDEYKNNFVLPKFFDRFQLRDHLIDIAGLQSHVSDATLFNKLSDLLEFS